MQLGLYSAILPDLSLEEVFQTARKSGYECVEVASWPRGKAERRYAGVTHFDVNNFDQQKADEIRRLMENTGIQVSALSYYPNPLSPDPAERQAISDHLKKLIDAAKLLGLSTVNTFVGRDQHKTVDENWPMFMEVWPPLVHYAGERGVNIGIENCPMLFTEDEWPGGKNLATSPTIWRRMFEEIPDENFGLNYDPSHFIWQQMDEVAVIREFGSRFKHVHAKDARLDRHKLNQVGVLSFPKAYHTPKLPGLGDVRWGPFFSALTDAGYDGPVCVEVEDRAYEGSLDSLVAAIAQSARYLRPLMGLRS